MAVYLQTSVTDMITRVQLSDSTPCIFRVPDSIRQLNPQCYTPRVVSIGPFHRNNSQLKPSEDNKIRYFKNFLGRPSERPNENKLHKMGLLVAKHEPDIRKCYPQEEIKHITSDDFCLMILVDATFIAELIIVMKGEGDPMTEKPWFIRDLLNDILLIENQIPLFIVYEIYLNFYREEDMDLQRKYNSKDLFLHHVNNLIKNVKNVTSIEGVPFPEKNPLHFIDYLRQAYVFGVSNSKDMMKSTPMNPKQEELQSHRRNIKGKQKLLEDVQPPSSSKADPLSLLKLEKGKKQVLEDDPPEKKKNWKSDVVTASRLVKYGVQFKEGTTTALKDITFEPKEGNLKINKVIVNDSTENIFRNIVAYEQCDLVTQTYVSDYLIFMDSLIDIPEDVDILIDAGIIQNDLRDDEKVSDMFNTLHKVVITEGNDYMFAAQSGELNDYRRSLWHRWKATWFEWKLILKRDYFYSPWSSFAFFVATIFLALTILQTVCSVYQAKGKKM